MSVVVGYVPDATGLLAVRQAAQQAVWRDTEVVVVNVVGVSGYSLPTAADEQTLDAIDGELTDAGVPHSIQHLEAGAGDRTAELILSAAEETGADLIVVGLKRKSAVAKAVLGSTAQRVLAGATCPVLTVRAAD